MHASILPTWYDTAGIGLADLLSEQVGNLIRRRCSRHGGMGETQRGAEVAQPPLGMPFGHLRAPLTVVGEVAEQVPLGPDLQFTGERHGREHRGIQVPFAALGAVGGVRAVVVAEDEVLGAGQAAQQGEAGPPVAHDDIAEQPDGVVGCDAFAPSGRERGVVCGHAREPPQPGYEHVSQVQVGGQPDSHPSTVCRAARLRRLVLTRPDGGAARSAQIGQPAEELCRDVGSGSVDVISLGESSHEGIEVMPERGVGEFGGEIGLGYIRCQPRRTV